MPTFFFFFMLRLLERFLKKKIAIIISPAVFIYLQLFGLERFFPRRTQYFLNVFK